MFGIVKHSPNCKQWAIVQSLSFCKEFMVFCIMPSTGSFRAASWKKDE